ncbi:MAG TPA: hypothetical protein VMM92_10430 [Thermoanaerobaculia bacterium]|nr:hypothetical protein [Thermoanaerobaculia bacterium]
MNEKSETKVMALQLEIEELEQFCNPGCGTSSTSPHCTCPVTPSTTGSLFTARTAS